MNKLWKTSEVISCDTCKREWEVFRRDATTGKCGRLAGDTPLIRLRKCDNCNGHYCTGCWNDKRKLCCECVDILGAQEVSV